MCLFNKVMTGRRFVTERQLADTRSTSGTGTFTTYDVTGYPDDPLDDVLYSWVEKQFWMRVESEMVSLDTCPEAADEEAATLKNISSDQAYASPPV